MPARSMSCRLWLTRSVTRGSAPAVGIVVVPARISGVEHPFSTAATVADGSDPQLL